MNSSNAKPPDGILFIRAMLLWKNTISYQLKTPKAATWLHNPSNTKAFMAYYSGASSVCFTLLHVIAEYVPTSFDVTLRTALDAVEKDSGLRPQTLQFAKFIKPLDRHRPGQQVAHAVIGFADRDAANHAL